MILPARVDIIKEQNDSELRIVLIAETPEQLRHLKAVSEEIGIQMAISRGQNLEASAMILTDTEKPDEILISIFPRWQ